MKVFVTGATGFIGSAVVKDLRESGHEVIGLARSDAGAAKLAQAGAQTLRGSLDDLDILKAGAAAADGVIHLAFGHTFPAILFSAGRDVRAIDALGSALAGTNKPLVAAGAILGLRTGQELTEDFRPDYRKVPRRSERAVLAWAGRGVRAAIVRLAPSVHGEGDKGFAAWIVSAARKNRAAHYVGDGHHRWAAVHRLDAAPLFRMALERGAAGGVYQGVSDEGLPFRRIAETVGRGLKVPTRSKSQFGALLSMGFLGLLAGIDAPASNHLTRQELGWVPRHPGLLDDLEAGFYLEDEASPAKPQPSARSNRF